MVAVIYYVTVIPLVVAWAMISLGPLGILLAHIQWVLQTNAITTMICRNIVLSHMDNQIFDITLYLNGQKEFLRKAKFIKVTEKPHPTHGFFSGSWQMTFPLLVVHLIRKGLILIILALLSLIPIFGPPITNQVLSGRRGFSYMRRYFALKGQSAAEAKDFQYEHLGLFFSFGMAAGILEFIPLFSIITITSNTIGAAKWSVDLIKKSQK
ncbi:hypothetical protein HG536_0F03840 [Torulaspora globosa]|uniref:Outer spore wall protein RRT8 n=1 Tax=Torulaspora globosa TaxID=48254 RepID=A0A7G3ZKM3_9SACH|nr:uncharacterized protein HG536_0F03840 [Torulaspora globosa]QLL34059.1 hypothetical protein HG536_0F03840 [Torulaspora globosa]